MYDGELSLEKWANFYVVASAAAATLVGLLFVALSLASERRPKRDAFKIRVYLTPVVAYFSSVLFLAALLTIPNQTPVTAAACTCSVGVVGLGYSSSLAIRRGVRTFYDHASDLIPYVALPFAAYLLVIAGGFQLLERPQIGLDLVAAGMLSLVTIAIRNAWAIAVSIMVGDY
jgi:hypothetical protein